MFRQCGGDCARRQPGVKLKKVVENILRHLGAWHDPPARPPPPGASEPYTYEPCDDVDPAPDYENVLTD